MLGCARPSSTSESILAGLDREPDLSGTQVRPLGSFSDDLLNLEAGALDGLYYLPYVGPGGHCAPATASTSDCSAYRAEPVFASL